MGQLIGTLAGCAAPAVVLAGCLVLPLAPAHAQAEPVAPDASAERSAEPPPAADASPDPAPSAPKAADPEEADAERDVPGRLSMEDMPETFSRARLLPEAGWGLAYRYDRGDFNKTEISLRWPLLPRLHTVARWDYSLKYSKTMGYFAGFEYESCCWTVRLVGQQLLTDPNGSAERQNAVFLQLELKGLTSIGNKIDEFLERGILGYETD